MLEIVAYSCVIILLPIIPAYILYTAIPEQQASVDGVYQGLNIKLKGAFAGYFVLALLLTGFIGARLVAESEYKYWTVEGMLDIANVSEPGLIHFSIEPPDQQVYPDGRFVIKNLPVLKGKDKHSILVLSKMSDGVRKDEVIHLEEGSRDFETKHELKFNNSGSISILTPINFKSDEQARGSWGSYSSNTPAIPVPVNNGG